MAECKAVIFDLNGVLLQSEYLSKRIHNKYGVPEDKFYEVLREVMAMARKSKTDNAFKLWGPHLKKLGLQITKEEFFNFWFSGEKFVPELLEYTKKLRKKGVKIFILSNNFKERTEYYRKNFPEIFENVDEAYFSWETGFIKPDPRAFQNILIQHKLKPENCLYFDDSSKNVEAAKGLGIDAQKYQGLKETKNYIETHCKISY